MGLEATELARWTRFAAKGGIGKCTATCDCVAESSDDLMFLKDDIIVVLMQLEDEDLYLGYCEGVVGQFQGSHVQFHSKLKRPVKTKRSSASATSTKSTSPSVLASSSPAPISPIQRNSLTRQDHFTTSHASSNSISSSHITMRMPHPDVEATIVPSMTYSVSSVSDPMVITPPIVKSAPQQSEYKNPYDQQADPHMSSPPPTTDSMTSPSSRSAHEGLDMPDRRTSNHIPPPLPLDKPHLPPEIIPLQIQKELLASPEPTSKDTLFSTDPSVSSPDPDISFSNLNESSRISLAVSDGEVGIGLSLLQDLANEIESDDENWSRSSHYSLQTPELEKEIARRSSIAQDSGPPRSAQVGGNTVEGAEANHLPSSQEKETPLPSSRVTVTSSELPISSSFEDLQQPQPPYAVSSRRPSFASSAASTGSWEGASDIYDDYRYSRYSVSSKTSRFSQGTLGGMSMHTKESDAPPVPGGGAFSVDALSGRPSIDEIHKDSTPTNSESDSRTYPPASTKDPIGSDSINGTRTRIALTITGSSQLHPNPSHAPGGNHESPLLHTNWGSPAPSPEDHFLAPSSTFFPTLRTVVNLSGAPASVASPSASANNPPSGIASAIRQRIEADQRSSPSPSLSNAGSDEGLGGRIVVEDDEELPSKLIDNSQDLYESPPSSPELYSADPPLSLIITNNASAEEAQAGDSMYGLEPPSPLIPSGPPSQPVSPIPPSPSDLTSLRPTLTDLRQGEQSGLTTHQRRSLFLPHPNAPKAPAVSSGPMYITAQVQRTQNTNMNMERPRQDVIGVMKMALAAPRPFVSVHDPRINSHKLVGGPTIYGRTEFDLSVSVSPVPITFSPQPFQDQGNGPPYVAPLKPHQVSSPVDGNITPRNTAPPKISATEVSKSREPTSAQNDVPTSGAIPRANFFPKTGGLRPRSRSFSGFNTNSITHIPLPIQRSQEEGNIRSDMPTTAEIRESLTSGSPSIHSAPNSPLSPTFSSSTKPTPKSSHLRPAPLSISKLATTGSLGKRLGPGGAAAKSPTSPLAQSMIIPTAQTSSSVPSDPSSPTASGTTNRMPHQLRQVTSSSMLQGSTESRTSPTVNIEKNVDILAFATNSVGAIKPSASVPPQTDDGSIRPSIDADSESVHSSRSQVTSPPPMHRHPSLRSKLSLPNIRRHRGRQDETPSFNSPLHNPDADTLQVKDMDFELVRPNIPHIQAARPSEDSTVLGKEQSLDVRQDHMSHLRADSPAISVSSGGGASSVSGRRSPGTDGSPAGSRVRAMSSVSNPVSRVTSDSEASMDAHRHREIKWMSLMSSTTPAQSRKSKKIRKLLSEGVPSSVRYLVWSLLTDGKARVMPGVYEQFGSRGRVSASNEIERDIQSCFKDQPHLHATQGPVLSLLQAYLTMVPDVQYTMGLTLIAGQLLLHAPEEDAFWIFVSIMDTHIRPYFSSISMQMEVDSALFSKALEVNDSMVSKKIFVDLGITPASICLPWFSSLFVGSLPLDYVNRVWDIFLFEGVPFLLRVALAIVFRCRSQILQSKNEESLLKFLRYPPPNYLPPTAEAFLVLASSVKLKDDDIRKQRVKMEAQVKRQIQARGTSSHGSISLPRV